MTTDRIDAALAVFKARMPDVSPSREIVREAIEAAEKAAWRPIEEAPKGGGHILVAPGLWYGKSCSIARYEDDKYLKKPELFWKRDDDLGQKSRSKHAPPTHFRPLPSPPEQEP